MSGLRTGSVRDQMLRAQLLVERLASDDVKHIGPGPDRSLLVLGGGAAGVTAALAAVRLGIDTTLVEQAAHPFLRQQGVFTRWLDPVEYDWPHAHWDQGCNVWGGQRFPLPYWSEFAHNLAIVWQRTWQWHRQILGQAPPGNGLLEFRPNTTATTDPTKGVYISDVVDASGKATGVEAYPLVPFRDPCRFAAAISCIGFSGERVSVASTGTGEYSGPEFWAPDELEKPALGWTGPPAAPIDALVSGGGDGAAQDFIRILTGMFARQLFEALEVGNLQDCLAQELLAATLSEDAARRAHAWSEPHRRPLIAYQDWHAPYERLADKILTEWKADPVVLAKRLDVLRPDIRATWLVGGEAPEYCFGLNRLLALLVARLHAEKTNRPTTNRVDADTVSRSYTPTAVIVFGYRLETVTPSTAHQCGPGACIGELHYGNVTATGSSDSDRLGPFHVIVVRHGAAGKPLFANPPVAEQLVPFRWPE